MPFHLASKASACAFAIAAAAGVSAGAQSPQGIQSPASPTFTKDVAPILYSRCVSCHRPGDIAPMSLLSYEEARPYARSIRTKVAEGTMPPWHAEAAPGTFRNDRRLTAAEKDTILKWVDAGAPKGDLQDMPAPPVFAAGWSIGEPDAILTMSKAFEVPAAGEIPYQYFELPTNFTEDKWVQAIELRPGALSVVHHILAFSRAPESGAGKRHDFTAKGPASASGQPETRVLGDDPPPSQDGAPAGNGRNNQRNGRERTRQGGSRGQEDGEPHDPGLLIATTAPGTNAQAFEPGRALLVKAGSIITFQMHYTASGKPTADRSSIGFVFAKQPAAEEVRTGAFMNTGFSIPPGAADHVVDSAIEFNADSTVLGIFPYTHLRGKSWEYRMVYPDGRSEIVLAVPKYDFNWQTYYEFTTPLRVPKGARLEATARYDNSPANKSNPDPRKVVHWGEQTWEEMQYTGITYIVDGANPARSGQ
jgi:hypothetical protein